ncbi:MAG: RDD family protein [Clostridia bacterium]|nr:RDD family protein [Clostridiales bacterium]MBQ2978231.1 RDD family protein [Clostridia bacterium]
MIYDLQKASVWKRISAYLFDGILLVILSVLLATGLSLVTGYDRYNQALDESYARYAQEYQVDFEMSLSEYEALSPEGMKNLENAYAALNADEAAVHAQQMVIQLTLMIASVSILLAFLALEFALPLILGNGQTLGKKIFGIAVMLRDGVKISPVALFIRTVLGKYCLETMVPVLVIFLMFFGDPGMMGPLVLLGIGLLQVILLIATPTNSLIHDCLATTVTVDLASQMIFDSKAALIAYKEKVQAEKAAAQPY